MKKRLIFILLIILMAGGSILLIFGRTQNKNKGETISTYEVRRGNLLISVSGSGTLEAGRSLDIVSRVGGTVIYVVEEGKMVKEKEVLVKLDPSDYKNTYEVARLNYENAKLNFEKAKITYETQRRQLEQDLKNAKINRDNALLEYNNAKKNFERSQELFKNGIISQNDLDSARNTFEKAKNSFEQADLNYQLAKNNYDIKIKSLEKDLEGAKLSLEQAKLNLSNAEANLNNTVVKAPFSGIVANISVKVGDFIPSNKILLTLLDTTNVELNLEVDETDIGKVSTGLPVRITCDAFPDEEFEGKIIRISPTATISSNIPIFKVRVRISNKDLKLKVGMSADGDIILLERRNVLLIPLRAVQKTGRRSYVEVLKSDGKRELVRVSLGEDDGTNVVVESGLSEGDRIVLPVASSTGTQQRSPQIRIGIPGIFR